MADNNVLKTSVYGTVNPNPTSSNWKEDLSGFVQNVAPSWLQNQANYNQQRENYNQAQNLRQQQGLKFGNLTPEQQAHVAIANEERTFGRQPGSPEFERVNTPTMTPEQEWASKLSLFGSAPGQVQKALPGLLPNIRKYGGRPGAFLSSLFEPDTSRIDEAADQERRLFEERIVPQINARYGAGQDYLRDRAIAQARTDLQERLVGMKAKAYESGLDRNAANSKELFEAGMKPRFDREWQQKEMAQEGETAQDRANKALLIKDPITGKEENFSEYVDRNAKNFDYKGKNYSKQFKAIYDNADIETKFAMRNMMEKTKGKPQPYTRKLRTADDFNRYTALAESPNKYVREIMSKNRHKGDMNDLFEAVRSTDVKEFERLAKKYKVSLPKESISEMLGRLAKQLVPVGAGIATGLATQSPSVGSAAYAASKTVLDAF